MLSIAVCDDVVLECISISKKIDAYLTEKGAAHTIKEFFSGAKLAECEHSFDIVFLDIKMEQMDGIKTAQVLRKKNAQFVLVFITSSGDYVYDAFDVEAFQYILKPVDDHKLAKVLDAILLKLSSHAQGCIVIKKNNETVKVDLSEVVYFEITGRIIQIHCKNYSEEYYEKISTLEQKVLGQDFFRCHKSYIIHLKYVAKYNKNEIIMDDGSKVLLSKRRYQEFSKIFFAYMKKQGGIL